MVHVIPGDRRVFRNVTAGYFDVIDLDTGTRVGEPFPLESSDRVFPTMVASARNGTAVYLGIGDAAVRRIELEPTRWLAMACEAAGRNLTRAEWTLYFGTIDIPYHATCAQYPAAP